MHQGEHRTARQDMAFASLCGGLALANAGLGAVHGFAGPFGGMYNAPHGAVCAALLPGICAANVQALRQRAPQHPALQRYSELATLLTGDAAATIEDALDWLQALVAQCEIPPLSAYGFQPKDAAHVVAKAQAASSMKANPILLDDTELTKVWPQCIDRMHSLRCARCTTSRALGFTPERPLWRPIRSGRSETPRRQR
jgi:alcohol dehydrogenase class IV